MKTLRFLSRTLLVGLIVALSAASASAKDKWINLRTKNFNIVSNAGEGDSRELALKLEQFRFIFSRIYDTSKVAPVPVTVMVFKSDDSFKPFKPLYNGKPANLAGYFVRNGDENVIALNIRGNELRPLALIYHEYTHLLTSYTARDWPAWLTEGMAELFSSFEVNKNKATLGAPIDHHVFFLREKNFLPLQTLFNVRRDSPEYNERSKQGVFYAQSWALAHYLVYGDKTARQKQLVRFLQLLDTNMGMDAAFKEAFQTDYNTMEKALREYINKSTYYAIVYTLDTTQYEREIEVSSINEAEAQSYLGTLLMRTNRLDEAEPYFKEAIALDPSIARSYEGLGFIAMRRNNYKEAKEHLKQAVSRDSRNYLAHYYYAESIHRSTGSRSSDLSADSASEMIEHLKASVKLMPSYVPAYSLLGFMYLTTGENLAEGAEMLKAALRIAPQNKHLALNLAQIQMRLQDYDSTKKTLAPLLAGDDEGLKQVAQSIINAIERRSRPSPQATDSDPDSDVAATPASDSDEQPLPPKPLIHLDGAETVSGVLASMECPGNGLVLVLKTADKLLRFSVSDPVKLQLFSRVPGLSVTVGCGEINLEAIVYFKPLSGNKSQFAGDAIAVEFTK